MRTDIPSGCDIRIQYRMALEIILNRHDETPWGFRMTGGKEFESPFFVVKVARGGIAERSGLCVGDMVYAINHEYADQYSHADAQRIIVHTGQTLILNIRRGELRPSNSTPLPDFSDAIMSVEAPPTPPPPPIPTPPPPYEVPEEDPKKRLGLGDMDFLQTLTTVEGTIRPETPKIITPPPEPETPETPEGELEQDAFFSIKIKRSGRISAIEELEGPSRSPSTGRSRSPSRERKKSMSKTSRSGSMQCETEEEARIRGERMEKLTTEMSEMTSTEMSSKTERKLSAQIDSSRKTSVSGTSQEQQKDEQIKTKKALGDLTDDDITDMLTGEAQVLDEDKGVIGINFNKLIPKVNFIKESSVLKAVEEQQFYKEESEEVQLAKEPTKRFSTFLQRPARAIPQSKVESDVNEDLPWKKRLFSSTRDVLQQTIEKEAVKIESSSFKTSLQSESRKQSVQPESRKQSIQSDSRKQSIQPESRRESIQNDSRKASIQSESESLSIQLEEIIEKEVAIEEESTVTQISSIEQTEEVEEEVEGLGIVIGEMEITDDMVEEGVGDDDERKSVRFEDEAENKSRHQSMSTVETLKLEGYSRKDVKTFKQEEMYQESKKIVSGGNQSKLMIEAKAGVEEQLAEIQRRLSEIQLPEEMQSHVTSVQEQLTKIVEMNSASDSSSAQIEESAQVESSRVEEEVKEKECEESKDDVNSDTEDPPMGSPVQNEEDTKMEEEVNDTPQETIVIKQPQEEIPQQQQQPQEPEGPEYCIAPPSNKFPHTPQPRPIVLPGGRKWRKPKDAFNDQYIAEAIIGQSEVLVGTTIGINFCKYIPAKFDGANSAVCRLIHEIEDRTKENKKADRGIEGRPEKVMAEEDYHPPISKRHFFAAKLAERQGSDQP